MKKNGFTLIELMVVITIMSILVGIGIVSYQKTVALSRDVKRKSDLEQIRQALESYRSENSTYPDLITELTPDYITSLPVDPKTNTYEYLPESSIPITSYILCNSLENNDDATIVTGCETASCGGTCNYKVTNP